MTEKPTNLRIHGLVRLMNRVRDQLRSGVPEGEAEAMRSAVIDAVQAVERICQQHRITPDALPAPSRRAYAYLRDLVTSKALDPGLLPIQNNEPDEATTPPSRAIEITGIVSSCNYHHRQFEWLVHQSLDAKKPIDQTEIQRLAARLRTETDAIKALCEEDNGSPADLPSPSRHGYRWLRYLSDVRSLARHLATLKDFTAMGRDLLRKLPRAQAKATLHTRIYDTGVLYRTQVKGQVFEVTINEGFVGAPTRVIKALTRAALRTDGKSQPEASELDPQNILKAYAAGDAFAAVQAELQATLSQPVYHAVGQYHDLNEAFTRVNTAYFQGKLDRPHLQWNRTRTKRKFGHYDESRDTVMVSQTLDAAGVPGYVVDFVVYHELLHKTLGTPTVKGRRRVHTPEFREAERAFRHYDEARKFITKLASTTQAEP